jgi:hypothetical protein
MDVTPLRRLRLPAHVEPLARRIEPLRDAYLSDLWHRLRETGLDVQTRGAIRGGAAAGWSAALSAIAAATPGGLVLTTSPRIGRKLRRVDLRAERSRELLGAAQ